jgi:ABC-type multidrug transport system ATPase subunit
MDETPIAVNVANLNKRYSKPSESKPALSDVSFTIPVGKIWCLLGPNGSGKTTLLKILAGLLTPNEGEITLLGTNTQKNPGLARTKVGWMPAEERSGFYGRLTPRQNLHFFGALQGLSKNEAGKTIGDLAFLMDFNEDVDRMVLKTSAGARQKFGLARALLHNPPILLLDEPMRNLDPHAVMRFRRLIRDHLVRKSKKTVLLSTHQLEEARRIADHILIIKDGRVIRSLDAKELESELKNKTVEEFYLKTVEVAET